jgi:hypothetical protein
MLMIDVRNAIANILDRFTLHDVVEVTLRRQSGSAAPSGRRKSQRHADPADGFLALLQAAHLQPAAACAPKPKRGRA